MNGGGQGPAAATGVALINSIANTGGMVGPALIGAIKHHYNSYAHAIMGLAAVTSVACILVYYLPLPSFAGSAARPPSQEKHALKIAARSPSEEGPSVQARLRDRPNKRAEQD